MGVEEQIKCDDQKFFLLISNISDINDNIDPHVEALLSHKVAGILSTSENISKNYMALLKELGIPTVFVDCYKKDKDFNFSYVTVDDFKGAYKITEYLIKNGHKNIGFINSSAQFSFTKDRLKGFKTAMRDNNLAINEENVLFFKGIGINEGLQAADILFNRNIAPTAIICINDEVAYGVLDFCYNHNIKVPEDVSVTGFDDNIYSSLSFVGLTTVKDPIREVGRIATDVLLKKIIRKNGSRIVKIIEPEVVIRDTIKAI